MKKTDLSKQDAEKLLERRRLSKNITGMSFFFVTYTYITKLVYKQTHIHTHIHIHTRTRIHKQEHACIYVHSVLLQVVVVFALIFWLNVFIQKHILQYKNKFLARSVGE